MRSNRGSFGNRLRLLRRRTGKTQLEVAQELKVAYPNFAISQANVSHLERRDSAPRADVVKILADYFGVQPAYFVSEEEDSYESRKPQIESYFHALADRSILAGDILLHTDDNNSGNEDTRNTAGNIPKFYRNIDVTGK